MKVYVIQRIGFQYNDEVHMGLGGNGHPIAAWRSKRMAEMECLRRNLEDLRELGLFQFCYGLDELNKNGLEEAYREAGIDPDNWQDGELTKVTDEQLNKIYEATSHRFYEVVSLEVEDDEL